MANVKIGKITLGACQTNCYFLYNEGSNELVVVDPADAGEYLYNALKDKGFEVKAIILTHGHFDHILGVKELKRLSECKVYACEKEEELLRNMRVNLSEQMRCPVSLEADVLLRDGEEVELCGIMFKCIWTPGHTEGSCSYYIEDAGFLIAGDTLFEGSVGRTDFPTGSSKTLIDSVEEKLFVLPDNTRVYPGHGGSTTIGFERENNPFF